MNTDLLFSSYPFISGDRVTLTRITELDLEALWDIWGDEENYRFWPTAALPAPAECARQLRQADQRFREKRSVLLGIYPNGAGQTLAGVLKLYGIDPRVEALSLQVMVAQKYQGRGYGSGAVEAARRAAGPGDVVVLSPACAAFDRFKNFMERGRAFKELVRSL